MPNHKREGKWQPFDGLQGYRDALRNTEKKRTLVRCPTLSEDTIQDINLQLQRGWNEKVPLRITYYRKGEFCEIEGCIEKINRSTWEILIVGTTIPLTSIYRIEDIEPKEEDK
ncbi:MAG: YolD-like family protein [Bacilli bacterium]|nr:YolD-like family protein [Bacilli bacterium]